MATIHSKLCECGCGEPAPVYQRNDPKRGHVKGQPARFIAGHNLSPNPGPRHGRAGPASRLCACGCGEQTPISTKTHSARGHYFGLPMMFIPGHNGGPRHKMSSSRTYASWKNMKRRCKNKTVAMWDRYGGRGISYCDRWEVFENFLEDMGIRPAGHSLDRVDPDGNYEPNNCRWASRDQQENNKTNCVIIEHEGQGMTIAQWSRKTGIAYKTLQNRYTRAGDRPPHLFRPVRRRE